MAQGKKLEAVVFDMDGVIIDSEPLWSEAERRLLARRKLTYTEQLKPLLMGLDSREAVRILKKHFDLGEPVEELVHERNQLVSELIQQRGQPIPHALEIGRAVVRPVRNRLLQIARRRRIRRQRTHYIRPVQRVEVVEVHDVVLHKLDPLQEVAHNPRIVRDRDTQRIFDCSHGADSMYGRSDSADALSEHPRISRVPPRHDQLDSTEHHPCAPGIPHLAVLDLRLNAQVPLNAGDRVNGYLLDRVRVLHGHSSWMKS